MTTVGISRVSSPSSFDSDSETITSALRPDHFQRMNDFKVLEDPFELRQAPRPHYNNRQQQREGTRGYQGTRTPQYPRERGAGRRHLGSRRYNGPHHQTGDQQKPGRCTRCGYYHQQCLALGRKCYVGNKFNHFGLVCRSARRTFNNLQ